MQRINVHESAYVDERAKGGAGTLLWHFNSPICSEQKIDLTLSEGAGKALSFPNLAPDGEEDQQRIISSLKNALVS
jgi:hypothetical protein